MKLFIASTKGAYIYTWMPAFTFITETTPASTELLTGTTIKTIADYYDYSTVEYRNLTFMAPPDLDPNGTINFDVYAQARTAPASGKNVMVAFDHCAIATTEVFDGSYITAAAAAAAISTTQNQVVRINWTSSVATAGWVSNDMILGRFYRNSASASDTLDARATTADDLAMFIYQITAPRA